MTAIASSQWPQQYHSACWRVDGLLAPAEGVMNPVRSFTSTLIGFAAAVIVAAVTLAIRDAGSFHRGGEFASAWQSAEFDLLTWGIVLIFSGGAFALVTLFLIPSGRVLPLPLIVGLVCGTAVVASFGFGFANHLQRSAGIPWPLIAMAPGVASGAATVALALVTNLFSGSSPYHLDHDPNTDSID